MSEARGPRFCDECRPGGGGVADRAFRLLEVAHVEVTGELVAACKAAKDVLERHADLIKAETMSACDMWEAIGAIDRAIAKATGTE